MFAIAAAATQQIFSRRNCRQSASLDRNRRQVIQDFRKQVFRAEFQFPGIVLAQRLRVDSQMLGNPILPRAVGDKRNHLRPIRLAWVVRAGNSPSLLRRPIEMLQQLARPIHAIRLVCQPP
jgi:hypothetical protein